MFKSTPPTCVIHPLSLGLRSLTWKTGVEGILSFCRDLRLVPGYKRKISIRPNHLQEDPTWVDLPSQQSRSGGSSVWRHVAPSQAAPTGADCGQRPGLETSEGRDSSGTSSRVHESGDGHEYGWNLMQTILPASLASSAPAPSQPAGQHLSCLWTEPATAQDPALS